MKRPHVIIPKNPDDTVKLRSNVDFRVPNHVMTDETPYARIRRLVEHSDGERDA